MHQFKVADMTCGHCVSSITRALKAQDPQAKVDISLADHLVKVESALPDEDIASCITEAGYTPVRA